MQEGMERAQRAANPEWWRYMFMLLIEIARRQEFLYTDDIERLRRDRHGPETHEQRAIGPIMRFAADAGLIERTPKLIGGRWDKRVWRSLIFVGGQRSLLL